ncbi:caspase family protein [Nocardia araoensis]|uniref:caspase family protein n=1 Tax=Nocardia araoensis TaxID=228600 RepID=UPI0002EEA4C7|nr:caspase family protein [Nocardia araoensis]
MVEPWFPDPAKTRAVLIGVSKYRSAELPDLLAVRSNLTDLRAALTDTGRGCVSVDGCRVLAEADSPAEVGAALGTAGADAEDLLLVYYSGHGLVDDDGRLCLTLRDTDPDRIAWTAVPLDLIRREFARAKARARILILDCCFSGLAVEAMGSAGTLTAGQLAVTGAFTLTSTTATAPSNAPRGARNTAFTGALLRALASRNPLTMEGIYRYTVDELAGLGLPRPQCRSVNTASEVMLVRRPPKATSTSGRIPRVAPPNRGGARSPKPKPMPKPKQPTTKSPTAPGGRSTAATGHTSPAASSKEAPPGRDAPNRSPGTSVAHGNPLVAEPGSRGGGLVEPVSWPDRVFDIADTPPWQPRFMVNIAGAGIAAVLSFVAFTDPYRNVSPSWFDLLVGWAFGLGCLGAVVGTLAPVALAFWDARWAASWQRLVLSRSGLAVEGFGARHEFAWTQIDRIMPAELRARSSDPTIVIRVRPETPRPDRPGVPKPYAARGLIGLGHCPGWQELFAALRNYAPATVTVERRTIALSSGRAAP